MTGLFDSIAGAKVYDLAQPYFVGMPHFPTHPPFLFSLTRVHGEYPGPEGHSSSAEAIGLGGHVGTHIDALCHFSYRGKLHGGLAISQSYSSGHGELTVDTIAPILRRALLLDIAGLQKVAALPDDFEVTAEELDRAPRRGVFWPKAAGRVPRSKGRSGSARAACSPRARIRWPSKKFLHRRCPFTFTC